MEVVFWAEKYYADKTYMKAWLKCVKKNNKKHPITKLTIMFDKENGGVAITPKEKDFLCFCEVKDHLNILRDAYYGSPKTD